MNLAEDLRLEFDRPEDCSLVPPVLAGPWFRRGPDAGRGAAHRVCGGRVGEAPLAEPLVDESVAAERVVFFDDFTGEELDRGAWNVELMPQPYNNEEQAYMDSPETHYVLPAGEVPDTSGGVLVLQPRFRAGYQASAEREVDFVSSRLNSRGKVEVTHGTLAARIKLPVGAGIWPAFWALGNGRWPGCGEIDILENAGDPAWYTVALHGPGYSGNRCFSHKHAFAADADATAWHVYSADWSADEVVFRLDGEEVHRLTREEVQARGTGRTTRPSICC